MMQGGWGPLFTNPMRLSHCLNFMSKVKDGEKETEMWKKRKEEIIATLKVD